MTGRPHFRHPPIIEQVITAVFEPLPLGIVDVGLFSADQRAEFSSVETTPRIDTLVETFEGAPAAFGFNIVTSAEIPRTVLRNDKGEVIQFQNDRFTYNWLKVGDSAEYPRFDHTLPRFLGLFEKFQGYLVRRGYPEIALQQGELSNVNIVPVSDFGSDFSDMSEAFFVPDIELPIPGLQPDSFVRRRQHRMVDDNGDPIGRLHVVLAPVFRNVDQQKAIQFELTARSAPSLRTSEQMVGFFEKAHDLINSAFVATVTPRMRDLWGEYDG